MTGITIETIHAAQEYDLKHRPADRGWSAVPDDQVARLLAGAADALDARREPPAPEPGGGQWQCIAFMGHLEYTGYVTEITKNGQPAYRIDLPEKVWGGNPLACITHSASSWFSDHPVTEESVRAAWVAQQERARQRARDEAEWARQQDRYALGAADDDTDEEGDDD
jgi:hypothetical protein